ncbi:MAG TPA: PD-(D/E)XK nuclease family protein [Candidatus Paceibacterota bacterium]
MDYKRCPTKWYFHWRLGLVPKTKSFGALDLGEWMHQALGGWYLQGTERQGNLADLFIHFSGLAIASAKREGAPEAQLEKAEELQALGIAMAGAYQEHYSTDKDIRVISAELPLEFTFPSLGIRGEGTKVIHRLKPDLVYADLSDDVWLMEHKTAASIRTEHLVIDDQARPYGAMAARALDRLGLLRGRRFKGIMYNFLRKALPDERDKNEKGQYLNKNGTVSKRQPPPLFVRHPVLLSRNARRVTLERIRRETTEIVDVTRQLQSKRLDPLELPKTPHRSCPRFCDYFTMCTMQENGVDTKAFMKAQYIRQDPYLYDEDSTEDRASFEMA